MTHPVLAVPTSGFGGRGYKHPHTGVMVPSVTTVLKAAAKPAITQWAVDQTAAYAVANIEGLYSRSDERGYRMLRWYWNRKEQPLTDEVDINNYHEKVLNDAAELGTAMHEWIQADVVGDVPYPDVSKQSPAFWEMVEVWNQFRNWHDIEPYFTENTVWNGEAGYAGTFDGVWKIDGKVTLLDIKTSRSLWPDHLMQIAALMNAPDLLMPIEGDTYSVVKGWQEHIEAVSFLHIRPNDVENDGRAKPAYVELVEATDLDLHYQAFLGLLQYKQAERAITVRGNEARKSARSK